jgi:hypothetical protein
MAYVVGMMELLRTAQFDRHDTTDESVPLAVSREEAEAVVHLALTLVHWFQTGSFGRRSSFGAQALPRRAHGAVAGPT